MSSLSRARHAFSQRTARHNVKPSSSRAATPCPEEADAVLA
jgi:hypothetical protein